MARKNPALIKGTLKAASIPKGKRKGDLFTKAGKRYMVISYTTSTGKRVRYAQAVSKCATPATKKTCKVKRRKARKNPYKSAPASACRLPRNQSKWRSGFAYVDGRGEVCVVQRTKKSKKGPRKYIAMAHTTVNTPTANAKTKKVGTRFTFNGQKYIVETRKTKSGGYKKIAKKVG